VRVSFSISDNSGCSYYRAIQIKNKALEKGLIKCLDNSSITPLSDIYVWQRFNDIEMMPYLNNKAVHIMEMDDNYWSIPNHLGECVDYFKKKIEGINQFINRCEYSTVTTEYLADVVMKNNPQYDRDRIKVFPNFINFDKLDRAVKSKSGKKKIAWTLDPRRADIDIVPVLDVLKSLINNRDDVQLIFFGATPRDFIGHENVISISPRPMEHYFDLIKNSRVDIGICPAIDNEFNHAKSNLKLLEYSALGIPSVCSNIFPYMYENMRKGEFESCHDICKTPEDWERSLTSLLDSDDLRYEKGSQMYDYVKENYNLDKGVYEYYDFWKSIVKKKDYWYESFKKSDKKTTIVTCSKNKSDYDNLKLDFSRNCKYHDVDFFYSENDGTKSLGDFYNYAVKSHASDYYVFCHSDIKLIDEDWLDKLLEGFKEFDVIGVAGTTTFDAFLGNWLNKGESFLSRGCVFHPDKDKKPYLSNYGSCGPSEVCVVDGLFIAVKREVVDKLKFNSFNKFHFYDMDFCLRARESGFKVGVVPIAIYHESSGSYDMEWLKALSEFRGIYSNNIYRSNTDDFGVNVLISPKLQSNKRALNSMVESLDSQSIKVYYSFEEPYNYSSYLYLNDYIVFERYAFELLNNVLKSNNFGSVTFKIAGKDYSVFTDGGFGDYLINGVIGRNYFLEYTGK
jgi:glycosyltransferase involved in cell wall biosynthesis